MNLIQKCLCGRVNTARNSIPKQCSFCNGYLRNDNWENESGKRVHLKWQKDHYKATLVKEDT